jgi:hypothetical protein
MLGGLHMVSALCVTCFLSLAAQLPEPFTDLLPRPQQVQIQLGQFSADLNEAAFVLRAPDKAQADRLSERLTEVQKRLLTRRPSIIAEYPAAGFELLVFSGDKPASALEPLPDQAKSEGYRLAIRPEGIHIAADSEKGLFYGMMTMEQLLRAAHVRNMASLPAADVLDWPRIAMRGFHEDYGRDQLPTVEDQKRTIRTLAQYKMNTHLWFIEPDHFVYSFDPELGNAYDRFTFDELREVVAYAKQYYIDVIPVVELLAHMENTLSNPKYAHLAEKEGSGTLCPTNEESMQFAEKLLGEISAAFDGKYFHCGLDESAVIGEGKSADAVKAEGIEKVYARYYTRLNDALKARGKTMVMYADIVLNHPAVMDLLPKDIVMMFWDYSRRPRYEGLDKLTQSGFQTMSLAGMWDWANLYPLCDEGFANMSQLAAQAAEVHSGGMFVSNWGDWNMGAAGANLSELTTYSYIFCGAQGWNPGGMWFKEYSPAFAAQYFGLPAEYGEALTLLATCQGEGLANNQRARRMFHGVPKEKLEEMGKATDADIAFWKNMKDSAARAHVLFKKAPVKMNDDYLQVHDMAARMLELAADFALEYREIASARNTAEFNGRKYAERIDALSARQQALWEEYRAAYVATNKPINLKYLVLAWDKSKQDLAEFSQTLRMEE